MTPILALDSVHTAVTDYLAMPKNKIRRATSPQSPTYKFARALMPVGNPEYRKGLVDAIVDPLNALSEDPSESTTLILTDRRQVCLYTLYRAVAGAPKLGNDHRIVSSLFLRLSSKARWASMSREGSAQVRAILSDDTRVHGGNGTLTRLARTANMHGYKVAEWTACDQEDAVPEVVEYGQSRGDAYWGIDFRPLTVNPKALNDPLAELNTGISRALAQHDIPRLTNHLVSRSVRVPLRQFTKILTQANMTVIDVTHASLDEGNCRSYTLLPQDDLSRDWCSGFGPLDSRIPTAKIRLFTRLDGDFVHVRVAPVVIADLTANDVKETLTTLGLHLSPDEQEELEKANGKGSEYLGSLGVEAHQLACYFLGALLFAQARKTLQELWGITDLVCDDEFATLVLGFELKELVDQLLIKSDQFSKTVSDLDVPETHEAQRVEFAMTDLPPVKGPGIYSISGDDMKSIISFLDKNQKDEPVTVSELVGMLNRKMLKKNRTLHPGRSWNYTTVSLVIDTLCAGGNISPTTVYDKKARALVNAYCTGESSGPVPNRPKGYGLGITREDHRPPVDDRNWQHSLSPDTES